jgi:TonB family protein
VARNPIGLGQIGSALYKNARGLSGRDLRDDAQVAEDERRRREEKAWRRMGLKAPPYILPPRLRLCYSSNGQSIQGTVVVEVIIGIDGLPKKLRVLQSCGYGPLDDEVVRAMREAKWKRPHKPTTVKYKFSPAAT